MAGRPPKPVAVRQAEGDTRKIGARKLAALDKRGPQPAKGEPEMPPGMSAAAKREWRRVVPELLATPGLLTAIDGDALAAYCEDMVLLRALRKDTNKVGTVVDTGTGPTMNPMLRQIDTLETRCIRHRTEFGMTPCARARVQVSPQNDSPEQDLAAMLAQPRKSRDKQVTVQ